MGTAYSERYQLGGGGLLTSQSGKVSVDNSRFITMLRSVLIRGCRRDRAERIDDVVDIHISNPFCGDMLCFEREVRFWIMTLIRRTDIYLYDRQTHEYVLITRLMRV